MVSCGGLAAALRGYPDPSIADVGPPGLDGVPLPSAQGAKNIVMKDTGVRSTKGATPKKGSFVFVDAYVSGFPILYASHGFLSMFKYSNVDCIGAQYGELVQGARISAGKWPQFANYATALGMSREQVEEAVARLRNIAKEEYRSMASNYSRTSYLLTLNYNKAGQLFVCEVLFLFLKHPIIGWYYGLVLQHDVTNDISVESLLLAASTGRYAELIQNHEKIAKQRISAWEAHGDTAVKYFHEKAGEVWRKMMTTSVKLSSPSVSTASGVSRLSESSDSKSTTQVSVGGYYHTMAHRDDPLESECMEEDTSPDVRVYQMRQANRTESHSSKKSRGNVYGMLTHEESNACAVNAQEAKPSPGARQADPCCPAPDSRDPECRPAPPRREGRGAPVRVKKILCKWYMGSGCHSGNKCRFAHGINELGMEESTPAPQPAAPELVPEPMHLAYVHSGDVSKIPVASPQGSAGGRGPVAQPRPKREEGAAATSAHSQGAPATSGMTTSEVSAPPGLAAPTTSAPPGLAPPVVPLPPGLVSPPPMTLPGMLSVAGASAPPGLTAPAVAAPPGLDAPTAPVRPCLPAPMASALQGSPAPATLPPTVAPLPVPNELAQRVVSVFRQLEGLCRDVASLELQVQQGYQNDGNLPIPQQGQRSSPHAQQLANLSDWLAMATSAAATAASQLEKMEGHC